MFRPRKAPKARSFISPRLEQLEDRWCPSTASVKVSGGVISIIGDGNADTIKIGDDGKGDVSATITSAGGKVLASASGTGINTIQVDGAGGNDTVDYGLTGALSVKESLKLDLGGGNVSAKLDYSAGIAANLTVWIGGGKQGTDTVATTFGSVGVGDRLSFREGLGKGTSSGTATFSGAIAAGAEVDVAIYGSSSHNKSVADFQGTVSGVVHVHDFLGDGSTIATVSFDQAVSSGAVVDVAIDGGKGNNQVTTSFGDVTGATVRLREYLGAGTTGSTINFGTLSDAKVGVKVDAGRNSHQVSASFGAITKGSVLGVEGWLGEANDTVALTLSGAVSGGSHAWVFFDTGTGNDEVTIDALTTDISAGSSLAIGLDALKGTKNLTVKYGGQVDGFLAVDSRAGKSDANISTTITDNAGSTGTILATERGGPGKDHLTLDIYDNSGSGQSTLAALNAFIYPYPGNDVSHTPNVKLHPIH